MKKIFVLGSVNMDLVIGTDVMPKAGETLAGTDLLINSGGKGANQAVAAAKCGANVMMFGAVGDDMFGLSLAETLKSYNVDTSYLQTVKGSSGTAVIIIENSDNRIILSKGANALLDADKIISNLNQNASEGDILITQLEIPQEVILKVFEYAKKLKLTTILNPAPAASILDGILKNTDIIIPNETEAEMLSGVLPNTDDDYINIAKFFNKRGIKHTIITLGKRGSVYVCDGSIKHIPAYSVQAVDTTAAGDSFIGGLASRLSLDEDIVTAARFGTAVSALAVTKSGAQQSIPTLPEVTKFIQNN